MSCEEIKERFLEEYKQCLISEAGNTYRRGDAKLWEIYEEFMGNKCGTDANGTTFRVVKALMMTNFRLQ
jgi:hypothetical protein